MTELYEIKLLIYDPGLYILSHIFNWTGLLISLANIQEIWKSRDIMIL